ncbi:TonB-dependent receptor domain-containing protein [Pedobacter cryoconitis]|uniref:Outer membrane beta-barrel protein n=1 Tax=Pedobacter cryoconitis TaxID=188932 RepID=A0A327S7H7_9SPHI|nr:TonB-dependent receptor [Pedobacter cryoconitis]RAJ24645.1 outer membrane beta-barrel protein [Pedobacter cryoconitis]
MKLFFLLAVSFTVLNFFPARLKAQHIISISGHVKSINQDALIGNIAVLAVNDSTLLKGTSFSNGNFEISDLQHKEVLLKFTSLLFADTIIHVKYQGQALINLGSIIIRDTRMQLNEIQIRSQTPLIKSNPNGNMEVNVASTILAGSSSVNEILSKAPNVIVNEGRISIFGKGDAIIYLNGTQITTERMASIPISQISKIEIITNPSSKYDAEGKAVINIVMKSNTMEGVFGSAIQQVSASKFAGADANTLLDLSSAKGKFSMTGNYGLLTGKSREILYTTRTRPAQQDYLKSELTTDWKRKYNNFSNFGFGIQYNKNPQQNISLGYSGNLEDLGGSQHSKNKIISNQGSSFYTSNIAKDEARHNHSLTLNYNKILDTLGSVLFAGSQYSHFNTTIHDLISETNTVNDNNTYRLLKNDVQHQITISSTQLDYAKAFNANRKLEVGTKFSYAHTSSGTKFLVAENGEDFTLAKDLSSDFNYTERIPAAYFNYSDAMDKQTKYGFGIRGEWTDYSLKTTVGGGQVVENKYFNFFPNLFIQRNISEDLKLRAAYTSKITRPRYQALNPFVIYQDPFTSIEGNPNLIPEKVHAFELGANYKIFDLKAGYNYTLNPLSAAALRGEKPNSYVLKAINLERDHTWFTSLSASFNTKWWTTVNTVNLSYSKSIDHQFSFVTVTPRPQVYLYSNNTFNVRELFKVQVLAWYVGDRYYGLYYNKSRSTITLGLEKNFFHNSLKGRLIANDIFHKSNTAGNYGVGQTDIYFDRTLHTNYFRLIASYTFGRLKNSVYQNKQTGQTENSRAN